MNTNVVWNRVKDNCCVSCGDVLISPKDAELSMCTVCLKQSTVAAQKQIKGRKSRTNEVKRFRIKIDPAMVNYKK